MEKTDIKSMDLQELQVFVETLGEKKFRAKQLYLWMHQKLVRDFGEMTNLSKAFREKLQRECSLGGVTAGNRYQKRMGQGSILWSFLMAIWWRQCL